MGGLIVRAIFWLGERAWKKRQKNKSRPWWIVLDIYLNKEEVNDKIVVGPYSSKKKCFEELNSDSGDIYSLSTIDAKAWDYEVHNVYATQDRPRGAYSTVWLG